MSTIRPGLGAKTGHAAFITKDGLTDTQNTEVQQIAEVSSLTESNKVRDEYQEDIAELPLPPQGTTYVFSFNGATGHVQGVSSVDGATGAVVISFDGGEL